MELTAALQMHVHVYDYIASVKGGSGGWKFSCRRESHFRRSFSSLVVALINASPGNCRNFSALSPIMATSHESDQNLILKRLHEREIHRIESGYEESKDGLPCMSKEHLLGM